MIDQKKEKLKTKENEKVEEKQEDKEKAKPVLDFLETLEDDEDVQNVYANLEVDNNNSKNTITTW